MLSLAQGQSHAERSICQKKPKKHVAPLITPSTSFLDVYEDKMSVCKSCVFPQCVEQGSVVGVMHRNVEQQMFSQIFNLNASIAVHHMIRLLDNLTVLVNSCTTAITANQPSVQRSSSQARTHAVTLCRVLHTVGNLTLPHHHHHHHTHLPYPLPVLQHSFSTAWRWNVEMWRDWKSSS